MEDEHYNYEFRTKAYSIIEPIFKQEISYRARFAANTLVSSLGISQDQATRPGGVQRDSEWALRVEKLKAKT